MNEVIEAMKERRSVRAYTDEVPSDEQIDQVVDAGLWAASGRGRQSPIVLAVTDRALRDRLSAMNARIMGAPEGTDPFYGAPVVLVVLADRSVPTHVYDGSLVMGNLMLAAHALGLGSCWIHRARGVRHAGGQGHPRRAGRGGRLRGHRPLRPGLSRRGFRAQAAP